jgi:hypothetical protein
MPDLVTHTAWVYFGTRWWVNAPMRVLIYIGTVLPDVLSRPLYILKPQWYPYTIAIHTPVFMLGLVWLLGYFFHVTWRTKARWLLLAGVSAHFLLDALQRHLDNGYYWLFPFGWQTFSEGLFWPETATYWTPIWIGLVLICELLLWLKKKAGSNSVVL